MDEQTALMNDEGAPSGEPGATLPPPAADAQHGPATDQPEARTPWYRVPVHRDSDDNSVGGVVSGLCRAYGFDRRTTRIALVLASLVLPVVVLVYVLAWILLPDSPERAQPLADIAGDRRRLPLYVALGLLVVAGGVGSLGSWFVFGDFPWGVGLIALGVLLWVAPSLRRDRASDQTADAPAGPIGSTAPAGGAAATTIAPASADVGGADAGATGVMPSGSTGAIRTSTGPTTTFVPPPMPATPRRRRVPIGSITALVVVGLAAAASGGDALGWWDVPVLGVVVTSLIALAAGLAVSTVVNGAWFLVPFVVLLGAGAGFLVAAEPSLDGGIGERVSRPSTVAQAEADHDLAVGELTLDLVDVPLDPAQPLVVTGEVGVGRLHVIVPADATIEVTSEAGTGHVVIGDREVSAGMRQEDRRTLPAIGESAGTIVLDLTVGIGEIDIDRDVFASAPDAPDAGTIAP